MHSFDVEMNNFVLFDLKMLNSLFTSVQKNAQNSVFPMIRNDTIHRRSLWCSVTDQHATEIFRVKNVKIYPSEQTINSKWIEWTFRLKYQVFIW